MRRFNTAMKPIYPARLAIATQRIPQRRLRNLSGFFDQLDLGTFLDQGKAAFRNYLQNAANGDTNAHIAMQNRAAADMDVISQQYTQYKNAGTLNVDLITRAQSAVQGIIDNFYAIAQEIGSARALQGAADISFYGRALIADMERDKATITGNPYFPAPGGGSGFPYYPGTSTSNYTPLILGGIALLAIPMLFPRRNKTHG